MEAWHKEAACKDRGEIFAPVEMSELMTLADRARITQTMTQMALEICMECPVRAQCLQETLEFERQSDSKPYLVAGGMSANQRYKILRGEKA